MNFFVLSQFNYCPIIWIHWQRQSNNLINTIHERALRIAYNDYISNFETLLEKDGDVSIHQTFVQTLATEIFKTKNDLNPSYIKNIFCPVSHNYNTRHQNLSYPNLKTVSYGLETFGYRANQIRNSLADEIKSVDDLKTFKMLLSRDDLNLCTCKLCKDYIPNLGYV